MDINRLAKRLELGLSLLSNSDEAFCNLTDERTLALGTCQVDGWRCFINLEHAKDGKVGVAQDAGYCIRAWHQQDGSPMGRIVLRNDETGCEWHIQI